MLCCLLFVANLIVLAIFAIWSYASGSPYNAFRATDNENNVCGATGSSAQGYPYSYFYNPISLSNRVCVAGCPTLVNGVVSALQCLPGGTPCSYTVVVNASGYPNTTITSSDFIGYDSYVILGRVCLPSLVVLQNAFQSYSTSLGSALKSSYLSDFITDIQNVNLNHNIELVLSISRSRLRSCSCFYYYVSYEMVSCSIGMVFYIRNYFNIYRCRVHIFIQRGCTFISKQYLRKSGYTNLISEFILQCLWWYLLRSCCNINLTIALLL